MRPRTVRPAASRRLPSPEPPGAPCGAPFSIPEPRARGPADPQNAGMAARAIRLPDRFYLPRTDDAGREVRDVMPWDGAVAYATDGERVGILYEGGRVAWLGELHDAPALNGAAAPAPWDDDDVDLADDFRGVNMDALVSGLREYMDRHPILKPLWREDLARLEGLLRR